MDTVQPSPPCHPLNKPCVYYDSHSFSRHLETDSVGMTSKSARALRAGCIALGIAVVLVICMVSWTGLELTMQTSFLAKGTITTAPTHIPYTSHLPNVHRVRSSIPQPHTQIRSSIPQPHTQIRSSIPQPHTRIRSSIPRPHTQATDTHTNSPLVAGISAIQGSRQQPSMPRVSEHEQQDTWHQSHATETNSISHLSLLSVLMLAGAGFSFIAQHALNRRSEISAGTPLAMLTIDSTKEGKSWASAREAIEVSQKEFDKGNWQVALDGNRAALEMRPNTDEARAAHYNGACCYAKLQRWDEAVDSLIIAVNDYDLKLTVILKDEDLEGLKARPEYSRLLESVSGKGGVAQDQYVKLRQEAKSPFMLTRTFIFGGFAAGAGAGLLIILTRLVAALKGGPDAPDLQETLQNLGINSGVLLVLVFFLVRDQRKKAEEIRVIEREEGLARLLINVNNKSEVTVESLRGIARPLVVAGTRSFVKKAMKAAEPYRNQIKDRGIELLPINLSVEDPEDKITALKAEMSGKGQKKQAKGAVKVGKKTLAPVDIPKWEQWLDGVKKEAGVSGTNVYVQLQLNGSIRASGVGMPPWEKLMNDIPDMDNVRSKMGDQI